MPQFNIPGSNGQASAARGRAIMGAARPGMGPPGRAGQVQVIGGRCVTSPTVPRGMRPIWTSDGQFCGFARKRRRMNPLNPKALSRATRRLMGFQREVKRVEKALRKISPPSRRRAPARRAPPCN